MKKRIVMLLICGMVIGSVSGCGRSRLDASIAEYNQSVAESTDAASEDYETAAVSGDIQEAVEPAESEEEYAEPVAEEDTEDISEELLFDSDNESSDESEAELFDATAVSESSAGTEISETTSAPAESYDDAVFISRTSYTGKSDTVTDTTTYTVTDTATDKETDFSYDEGCGYGYEYCYNDDLTETENEVLRIKQMYNEIEAGYGDYIYRVSDWGGELLDNGYYQKIVLPVGVDGSMYERRYYYKNHELFFAFYRQGANEHRFYFSTGNLIKWIFDKDDIDKEENWQGWLDWESIVLFEGGDLL